MEEAKEVLSSEYDIIQPMLDELGTACAMYSYIILYNEEAKTEEDQSRSGRLLVKIQESLEDLFKALVKYSDSLGAKNALITSQSIYASSVQPAVAKWTIAKDRFVSFTKNRNITMEEVADKIKATEGKVSSLHIWTYSLYAFKELNENMKTLWLFSQEIPKKHADILKKKAESAVSTRALLFNDLVELARACLEVDRAPTEESVKAVDSAMENAIDTSEDACRMAEEMYKLSTETAAFLDSKK